MAAPLLRRAGDLDARRNERGQRPVAAARTSRHSRRNQPAGRPISHRNGTATDIAARKTTRSPVFQPPPLHPRPRSGKVPHQSRSHSSAG